MQAAASMVGQTRPGRLGEHLAPSAGAEAVQAAADPDVFVKETSRSRKAVVFSKLICPSCRKAKEIMSKHLPSEQYTIIELDTRPDCDQLQDALERLTGKHSVPVVFLNGEFIGGADQLGSLESSGQLAQHLRAEA